MLATVAALLMLNPAGPAGALRACEPLPTRNWTFDGELYHTGIIVADLDAAMERYGPMSGGDWVTSHHGGNLRIGRMARFVTTVSGRRDYTSVLAAGDLMLDGDLAVDVQGHLTRGTELTIMQGRAIKGTFRGLAEGSVLNADGDKFRVSYQNNSVTLTVVRAQRWDACPAGTGTRCLGLCRELGL